MSATTTTTIATTTNLPRLGISACTSLPTPSTPLLMQRSTPSLAKEGMFRNLQKSSVIKPTIVWGAVSRRGVGRAASRRSPQLLLHQNHHLLLLQPWKRIERTRDHFWSFQKNLVRSFFGFFLNISTCPRSCFFSITTWGLVSNQNFLSDHPSFPKKTSQRKNCRHLSKTIEHSPLRQPLPRLSVGKLNHIEDKTNTFFIKIHDIIVKATKHQKPSKPTWEAQKQLPWQMWNISGSGD